MIGDRIRCSIFRAFIIVIFGALLAATKGRDVAEFQKSQAAIRAKMNSAGDVRRSLFVVASALLGSAT